MVQVIHYLWSDTPLYLKKMNGTGKTGEDNSQPHWDLGGKLIIKVNN